MESIFRRSPSPRPPTVYDRIGPEIKHLQKGTSVRGGSTSSMGAWMATAAILCLLSLFFMDPFLYAWHKSDAIKAYLYLHKNYSESSTQALASSGIFSSGEIREMNEREGAYDDYFTSADDARQTASGIVGFMVGLHDLRNGKYDVLDPVGKLRYLLFVRIGLTPPMVWSGLNPSVLD